MGKCGKGKKPCKEQDIRRCGPVSEVSGSASVTVRQRGGSGTRREGGTALLADGPLVGLRRFPVQVRALAPKYVRWRNG